MTREEIIKELEDNCTYSGWINLVNEIYDDFESRTCENCRFDCSAFVCFKGIQRPMISIINGFTKEPSFGCNKWESK